MNLAERGVQHTALRAVAIVAALLMLGAAGPHASTSRAEPAAFTESQSVVAKTASAPEAAPATAVSLSASDFVMPASAPTRVTIPAIGAESKLMDLGLLSDGTLEVPPGAFPAGWYTGAPTPGELGPAILAGHVTLDGKKGVFYRLHELRAGDEIFVTRADGTVAVFAVTNVGQYPKTDFPTELVYGDIDHAGLRILTCGGELDSGGFVHKDNIVVFAALVRMEPAP